MRQTKLQLERNDKKCRCTKCRETIIDGKQILVKRGEDGKIKAKYCKESCAKE